MMTTKQTFSPNPSEFDIDPTLHELAEHGDLLFNIGVHYTRHPHAPKIMIHKHWHREMEILYVEKNCLYVEVENQTLLVKAGEMLFIPPNQLHTAYRYEHQPCDFYAIVFDSNLIASYASDRIQQSYIEPIIQKPENFLFLIQQDNPYFKELQRCIKAIIQNFSQDSYAYELLIKGNLFQFFYFFFLLNPEKKNQNRKKEDIYTSLRIKKILVYIEEHYTAPIPLNDIAKELGISKEHFCRFFKKNFRISFSDYLTEHRIRKAASLLTTTEQSIIDIALESGFDSANYFSVVFKKVTGETPTSYRKRAKK